MLITRPKSIRRNEMRGKRRTSSEVATSTTRAPDANGVGGEHAVGREQVAELQRARILSAMVREVSERGAANVSVAHVVARSGVSRRTFYEIFEDREDCFLAAFEEAIDRTTAVVVPAFEQSGS